MVFLTANIKWNFTTFLISSVVELFEYYVPITKSDKIEKDSIEAVEKK